MNFSSDHAITARNEALANAHLTSNIMIESLEKLLGLYASTGKATLAIIEKRSRQEGNEGAAQSSPLWHEMAGKHGPAFISGYLQISHLARERLLEVVEAQMLSTGRLAKLALDKTCANFLPGADTASATTAAPHKSVQSKYRA
ncbi:MAG: hypothetical protein D4R84_05410 [Rhodocyclaceae bacterium]|nr:MAG: hypothetical protein D4R84_05410 [Rhodocyclaceae bacterium]